MCWRLVGRRFEGLVAWCCWWNFPFNQWVVGVEIHLVDSTVIFSCAAMPWDCLQAVSEYRAGQSTLLFIVPCWSEYFAVQSTGLVRVLGGPEYCLGRGSALAQSTALVRVPRYSHSNLEVYNLYVHCRGGKRTPPPTWSTPPGGYYWSRGLPALLGPSFQTTQKPLPK